MLSRPNCVVHAFAGIKHFVDEFLSVLSDAILVEYEAATYTVRLEDDGTVLLSTLRQIVLHNQIRIKGLRYIHTPTECPRLVRRTEGKFHPPKGGWGSLVYKLLIGRCQCTKVSNHWKNNFFGRKFLSLVSSSSFIVRYHSSSTQWEGIRG